MSERIQKIECSCFLKYRKFDVGKIGQIRKTARRGFVFTPQILREILFETFETTSSKITFCLTLFSPKFTNLKTMLNEFPSAKRFMQGIFSDRF
ncbi:hypothetical protein LEP1GSC193_0188 [Leptospira alstonii serovar Pingchang str. 80-412]|uniref:Uncharacterized protein n=2 Tax=Leptospira alstonii TaxID=28452 RepID=M6CM39_9LEPT|nr:hypothetical protein LEP1GSC194_3837 [Leptospira alstonii serovar Sichuan str. 79601]EQA78970.1 hypothetical protein LEP1GSC193_0188 [Leptospira alstonii serovar Pingchang str. 80-412]